MASKFCSAVRMIKTKFGWCAGSERIVLLLKIEDIAGGREILFDHVGPNGGANNGIAIDEGDCIPVKEVVLDLDGNQLHGRVR